MIFTKRTIEPDSSFVVSMQPVLQPARIAQSSKWLRILWNFLYMLILRHGNALHENFERGIAHISFAPHGARCIMPMLFIRLFIRRISVQMRPQLISRESRAPKWHCTVKSCGTSYTRPILHLIEFLSVLPPI